MPLQCTAFTPVPQSQGMTAVVRMTDIPEDEIGDILSEFPDFSLCDLGEHDEVTGHGSVLWVLKPPNDTALWVRWLEFDEGVIHRFELLPFCPARAPEDSRDGDTECALFADHPIDHSWAVTDPLKSALARLTPADYRRLIGLDDHDRPED